MLALSVTLGKNRILQEGHTVQPPQGSNQIVRQECLKGTDRRDLLQQVRTKVLILSRVLAGHENAYGGQTMFQGISA